MQTPRNLSMFQNIISSELNGFRVRKRPCFADVDDASRIGAFNYRVEDDISLPKALSFCKTSNNAHILAVTDDDGYVCLYNTGVKFSSSTSAEMAEKARKCGWLAHDNAIFDVCWIKDDTNLRTACADNCIKLWDSQERKCILSLTGHTGSVNSISPHPSNHEMLVSGSRDSSFALWDLRRSHLDTLKIESVQGGHTPNVKARGRSKASFMSVTSVLYLKDEVSIATAGAVNSVLKFWDTRSLKAPIIEVSSQDKASQLWSRPYGISSLSQDLNGVYISASCMDNRIYLFNVLQLEKGPIKCFKGCSIDSLYVNAKLSPDVGHLLSGSSDGWAYLWQVNKSPCDPIILEGHDGEVTAVDWCSHEVGKTVTATDDSVVRLWNINKSCYSTTRSTSSIGRRQTTLPIMKHRELLFTQDPVLNHSVKSTAQIDSSNCASIAEKKTPKAARKHE